MVSGRRRWYDKGNQWSLRVTAMCPNQGSASQFGGEKMGEMSTRPEALQGSRKRHESSTLTATARVSVRFNSAYTLGTDETSTCAGIMYD